MKQQDLHWAHKRRGFTLLFSVLVSGLVLAIGIGIFNIVYREIQLSTLTRDSDTALYAADAGAECALFWEFKGVDQVPPVLFTPGDSTPLDINCGGNTISITNVDTTSSVSTTTWTFVVPVGQVTASGISCAEVVLQKNNTTYRTSIDSNGRNDGGQTANCTVGPRTVERTLEYNF